MTNEEYISFMCNPDNIRNCDCCPECIGCSDYLGILPCGQFHCWVELTCDDNHNNDFKENS